MWVGVASVHETVNESLVFESKFLTYLDELEEMIERRVNAAIRSKSHEMELLTSLFSVCISGNDLWILRNRTVLACTIDLYEVLINDTSSSDIEVTHLRVTHLSVRKTYVFTRRLKLRVSRNSCKIIQIRCRSVVDNITFTMLTDSPSVENHQKCFLCHFIYY